MMAHASVAVHTVHTESFFSQSGKYAVIEMTAGGRMPGAAANARISGAMQAAMRPRLVVHERDATPSGSGHIDRQNTCSLLPSDSQRRRVEDALP